MSLVSQLLESPPSLSAMHYLAQCEAALYRGELAMWTGRGSSGLRKLSDVDPPGVWAWELDGETVVACPGTTNAAETAQQVAGWLAPTAIAGGGSVNSYYHSLVEAIFPSLPNRVDVIAGHSMGAALAMLLARKYKLAGLHVPVAFGFGCPRPVTLALAGNSTWGPIVSVVNEFDPVPLIPTSGITGPVWATPPRTEWLLTAEGITLRSQPSSTSEQLQILAASVGDTWHSTGAYISLLTPPPVSQPHRFLEVSVMPAEIYQFEVNGLLRGEQAQTKLQYVHESGGAVTLPNAIAQFRSVWRNWVLAFLSDDYSVVSYRAKRTPSILLKADPEEPEVLNPYMRWGSGIVIAGEGDDVGADTRAPMPTFMAVGFEKILEGWHLHSDAEPEFLDKKTAKGAMRLAGLVEEQTDSDGDLLTTAALLQFKMVADALRRWQANDGLGGVHLWQMCVTTMMPDGALILDPGPPAVASLCFARVTGFAPDRYVTTQRTRKKRKVGN